MGTCFGVQDAIDMALSPEFKDALTVVGQLVHNPQTVERLRANGVSIVERDQIDQDNHRGGHDHCPWCLRWHS